MMVWFIISYQNQNRRRQWTSASCTQTPLARWPRWDRQVGGPLGCSHQHQVGDWWAGRQSGVSPLVSAGWRDGGCAWHQPVSGGCPLTCSWLNWPKPGYHGSSVHKLEVERRRKDRPVIFGHKGIIKARSVALWAVPIHSTDLYNHLWYKNALSQVMFIPQVTTPARKENEKNRRKQILS